MKSRIPQNFTFEMLRVVVILLTILKSTWKFSTLTKKIVRIYFEETIAHAKFFSIRTRELPHPPLSLALKVGESLQAPPLRQIQFIYDSEQFQFFLSQIPSLPSPRNQSHSPLTFFYFKPSLSEAY